MGNFSILGKTKWAKFGNILGLIVLAAYLLSKTDIVKLSATEVHKRELTAQTLNVRTKDELLNLLDGYKINESSLTETAKASGIFPEEFKKSVKIEYVINNTEEGFDGLTIEYQTEMNDKNFDPVYDFIANDIKQYVLSK